MTDIVRNHLKNKQTKQKNTIKETAQASTFRSGNFGIFKDEADTESFTHIMLKVRQKQVLFTYIYYFLSLMWAFSLIAKLK